MSPINGLKNKEFSYYKYFVPNGTQDRFSLASISSNVAGLLC
jgi:hypothetical protein